MEVRVDGGDWKAAEDESDGNWSKWSYTVDLATLGKGNHSFEARAVSGDQHSLYHEEVVTVEKTWSTPDSGGSWLPIIAIIAVVAITAIYFIVIKGNKKQPQYVMPMEPAQPTEPQDN